MLGREDGRVQGYGMVTEEFLHTLEVIQSADHAIDSQNCFTFIPRLVRF